MKLSDGFWELAECLVDYVHRETGFKTIVCDERGIITRAFDKARIGNLHAGAQKILTTPITEIAITREDELRDPLIKEGFNCAIVIEGEKVATCGIAGELRIVQPLVRIAAMLISLWVKQMQQRDLLRDTAQTVSDDISVLTEKARNAAGKFETVARTMAGAATQASESVATSDKILNAVQKVVLETYLLSINAGIEAGRLGEQGRAFACVAEEMGRLAQSTKEAMESVQNTIADIRRATGHVNAANEQFSIISAENLETMQTIGTTVAGLMTSITSLEQAFQSAGN